jgi:hydrogenase maturation protein HypF
VVETETAATRLTVRGVVQGVGFRPFVYRIAHRHGVRGWIANSSRGVVIEAEGGTGDVEAFAGAIESEAPPLARIERLDREEIAPAGFDRFEIRTSRSEADESTLICPDVAVCRDCLAEFRDPSDRRHRYPFINCTNCGPRFSIIEGTPYDRPRTSMRPFTMCERCQREYDDPLDRRFHAQPNACPVCGPALELVLPVNPASHTAELIQGRAYARMPVEIVASVGTDSTAAARWLLKRGAIIGVRGLGGFHIAASAEIDATVRALREKKDRPAKPFALMCRSIDVARDLVELDGLEAEALTSPWSPIVLLRKRPDPERVVSDLIAPRNRYLGIMLPYAPLHHLLFDDELEVLIMTSANPSDEPIVASVGEAGERLRGITRTFVDHDRGVVNRNDDSIVFVEAGRLAMSRRSRGYAPYPIDLHVETGEVLACGTELKNTFTLLRDGSAFTSQHIGDMENQATLEFFEEMVGRFMDWFRVEPTVVAHDLHPDYLATRYAKDYARERTGVSLEGVQHHHAHIASVMVENGVSEPVIGLSLDGTGYGTDGKIWGCEFLVADLADFERAGHLGYVPLPGGDAAIRHPYRVALSHLHEAGERDLGARARELFPDVPEDERELVVQQIEKGVNVIDTSSAGRLFDAVSAILGICHEITYEAQAAIELESVAHEGEAHAYPTEIVEREGRLIVDPAPIVRAVVDDAARGALRGSVAGAFHNTVVGFCREAARRLRDARGIGTVALSGGVFQNRLLLRKLVDGLAGDGFRVLLHREVPTNDGGVSLGQAVVANERMVRGLRREASP